MEMIAQDSYEMVISEIVDLRWTALTEQELTAVALAYYYFSIQFRENLAEAALLYPDDKMLRKLVASECDTDNLSPWPGIAAPGEAMNHDEFMRRAIELSPIAQDVREIIEKSGTAYLEQARSLPPMVKACSIASYENGGLERTFRAMLTAPHWKTPALRAFHYFLTAHIQFDSDPDEGHGALSRHLTVDDRILPLWVDFRDLLLAAAPSLSSRMAQAA